jgi:hypothetical protein
MPKLDGELNAGRGLVADLNFHNSQASEGKIEAIENAIWQMIKDCPNVYDKTFPPLDTQSPTLHLTKSEYLEHLQCLIKALEASTALKEALLELTNNGEIDNLNWLGGWGPLSDDDPDEEGPEKDRAEDEWFGSQEFLVHRLVASFGYSKFSISATKRNENDIRRQILRVEESQDDFWNLAHRPPNYHA